MPKFDSRMNLRRLVVLFGIALAALGIGSTPGAHAETIRSFDAAIRLQKDTTMDVVETIVWDFEGEQKHGIFRLIPIRYARNQGTYTIYLDVLSVSDGQGRQWKYETSHKWSDLEIKIGDANKTLTGVQTYVIHYKVRRAVNFFKDASGQDAPEVYWNATGDEWDFPIGAATARFYPPPGVAVSSLKTTAFQGTRGSTQPAQIEARGDHVLFSAGNLSRNEGLTIVVGLPAGSVVKPTATQNLLWILADWWPAFLLPLLGAGVLLMLYLQGGRDVEGGQAIAVEWNPPTDLSPAQVGTLVDEHCDMADIVSTLVDLAARGYLIIEETESTKFLFLSSKDYTFIKRPDGPPISELQPYEREFFKGVFGAFDRATLSSLKNKFYQYLPGIKSGIYNSLVEKHLFNSNPESTRTAYVGTGIVLIVLGVIGFFVGLAAWGIGLLIVGVLCAVFARAMPSKTATGSKYLRQCLSFKRYVELAEKERIKVLADKDPTIFGRLLPYAMVLGVADQWADAFKDLITEPPDWYVGHSYGNSFLPYMFVNDLGRGMNSMGQTFSSQPQSTGGSGGSGFSGGGGGGGFGGGGGSSW
jgi:uncharacterized membrane protein YgcG